jgi:hypothetical protein
MDFREKIESALTPLIAQLNEMLASLPTITVLNHYQLLIHTVQTDKSKVPDGFFSKWRYIWALQLSNRFSDMDANHVSESQFKSIDELIEQIFDVYGFGAMLEPGRSRGSEKEFLTRLGLALKVREPDILGFPEQIQSWASARLEPFNDLYFLPTFGLRFEEIMLWLRDLMSALQSRLNALVTDLASIRRDMEPIRAEFASGYMDFDAARNNSAALKIGERLDRNASQGERMHLFSREELQRGIRASPFSALTKQFGIRPGEVQPGYVFPHHDNPLEYKTFVAFPDGTFYFLDPAATYRVVAKTFEKEILANDLLRVKHSVQFGYEQANEVKQRILESEEITFLDEKGEPYFSVRRSEINNIYILLVTITPRGPFGTDLSYELKKPDGEPFPLAVNLFDLETICKHLSPQQLVAYLDARERLHGRVRTGDELNYAGYFLQHGNLDLQNNTFVTDDFSGVFDRRWYRDQGIEVDEPNNPPVQTSMMRNGNRVTIEHNTGRKEVLRLPPWMIESATGRPATKMKGSERNKPCPCGSGRKLKNCCGTT